MRNAERGAQDISLYAYACRSSKATSDLSMVLLFPSASFPLASYLRLHIPVVTFTLTPQKVTSTASR